MNLHRIATGRVQFLARFNPNHRHDFHLVVRRPHAFEIGDSKSAATYTDILAAFERVVQALKNGVPSYRNPACSGCGRRHRIPKIEVWYYVMTDFEVLFERHGYVRSVRQAMASVESAIEKIKKLAETERRYCSVCGRLRNRS